MKRIALLLITTSILFGGSASAQQQPCSAPGFHDFDFWLGEWDVAGFQKGKHAGENSIKRLENDCAISETWKGAGGSTGYSLNHFNPITGKWRQLWVSSGGYSIDIEGGLNANGAMELIGYLHNYATKASIPFKGTWTPLEGGKVRQKFEQYDVDKDIWNVWFDGLYSPKP